MLDLLKMLESPNKHIGKLFVTEGNISNFSNIVAKQVLYKLDNTTNKVFSFKTKLNHSNYRIMYNLQAHLTDKTSIKKSKFLNVQIINPNAEYSPFDTWKVFPPCEDTKRWLNIKPETFDTFSSNLNEIIHH